MKVLVVGATGFIGREVVKLSCDEGWDVAVGARDVERAKNLFKDYPIEVVKITLPNVCDVGRRDVVFNLAALLPKKEKDVGRMMDVNGVGTFKLLESCEKHGVDLFIQSSSMSVFGPAEYLPVDEEHPKKPRTAYGVTKLTGELFCNLKWDVRRIILRYSTVYGPGMDNREVVAIFTRRMLRNEDVEVFASNSSDFVYVEDAARANVLAAKKMLNDSVVDFNIGSGEETTIGELAEIIKEIMGSSSRVNYKESPEVRRFYFDISKARELLGYSPKVGLREGIERYISYVKESEKDGGL